MGLEAASFVTQLVATNPLGTDKETQGDDHLRLVKGAIQGSFPTASKAWYNPTTSVKAGNYSVVAADMNATILVDTTSSAWVMTLPTLVAGDAGWECSFIKTNTAVTPFFIAPPSGTIQSGEVSGLARTRRSIPGHRTRVLWTGSLWIAERVTKLPLGAIVDCPLAGLPVGYEWANGQTLVSASTNYPDYFAVNASSGVVPDRRGRAAFGKDDMGGVAALRVTSALSGVDGITLGAVGGAQNLTIGRANLPPVDFMGDGAGNVPTASFGFPGNTDAIIYRSAGPPGNTASSGGGTVWLPSSTPPPITMGGHIYLNGTAATPATAMLDMPPAQITNLIVVVE